MQTARGGYPMWTSQTERGGGQPSGRARVRRRSGLRQPAAEHDVGEPRAAFGFAYKLSDRMVVRGGAGSFYSDFINRGLLNRGLPNTGFSTTASFATGDNGITPAFNWDNGFPQNFARPPNIESLSSSTDRMRPSFCRATSLCPESSSGT